MRKYVFDMYLKLISKWTVITGTLLIWVIKFFIRPFINEYLQMIPLFGRTFDYLDILSSVVGVFIGHFVFGRLMTRSVWLRQRAD